MALKDWKKDKIGLGMPYSWHNKKIDMDVSIFEPNWYNGIMNSWSVSLESDSIDKSITFKTKSQALKFAKSYMRTH